MIFRAAKKEDLENIWDIILYAKECRKKDNSQQWQDGYPNEESIEKDIQHGYAYLFEDNTNILAYGAIILEEEPAYTNIEGAWLTNDSYAVIHRIAASKQAKGLGLGYKFLKEAEKIVQQHGIKSIKIDTNFDNYAMLKILDQLDYQYCGEVYFRGSARKAFEKVL